MHEELKRLEDALFAATLLRDATTGARRAMWQGWVNQWRVQRHRYKLAHDSAYAYQVRARRRRSRNSDVRSYKDGSNI